VIGRTRSSGRRRRRFVGAAAANSSLNIDLACTLPQRADAKSRLPQAGRSLLSLLKGESPTWRNAFVVEYPGQSRFTDGGPPPFRALHTERWLYVSYHNGWCELYDLRLALYAIRGLAHNPAHATLRTELAHRLHALNGHRPAVRPLPR
jgi:N-acetylglucosamine-6-sulfatase